MKILLAAPRGFCAGVDMAVASVERALELYGPPLYVYHHIIHNDWVVAQFERRGVVFVDDLSDVPTGSHLIFSAHGVSPEIREQSRRLRLLTVDATCPLVRKVHEEAAQFARRGFTIFLIGHHGHDEVVGTMGVAPAQIQIVESAEAVAALCPPDPEKTAYVMQTTLSVDDAMIIVDKLRQRFPKIQGPPKSDICYATQNRQAALRESARRADLVLVVGSPGSSNSNRLTEVARNCNRRAYLIDSADDIHGEWFRGDETVLITAGASTPEILVRGVVQVLCDQYAASVEQIVQAVEQTVFPLPAELQTDAPVQLGESGSTSLTTG